MRCHPESCIQLQGPQDRGSSPEKGSEDGLGLKHLSYEERLERVVLFSLVRRMLWGDLISALQFFKGVYKKDRDRHFSRGVMLLK